MDQATYDELQAVKEEVKKRNIEATAQMILDLRSQVYNVQNEIIDLRRLVTNILGTHATIEAKLNAMIAITSSGGGHGEMGN